MVAEFAPAVHIVSLEAERARRRAAGHMVRHAQWPVDPHTKQPIPFTRLITLGASELVAEKFVVDVAEGREEVPLLYGPIYQRTASDSLPRLVDVRQVSDAAVVFLLRFEGGETRLGLLAPGAPSIVPIVSYSAGFEWTREEELFDETWRVENLNQSFGRAYNALLNNLHLGPILSYSYTAANQTPADATAGADLTTLTRNTIQAGMRTAAQAGRPASVLLTSSAELPTVMDALARRFDSQGNSLAPVTGISTLIAYDGYTITVGDQVYTYSGVAANKAYLIEPRMGHWHELVRTVGGQDLEVVTDTQPDISRNIAAQTVRHSYRGVYADVANAVEELTLP